MTGTTTISTLPPGADPDAVHETPTRHGARAGVRLLRLAVAVAGDLVLVKAAFDHALRMSPWASWTLAVGVTLVAVSLAHAAGGYLRALVGGERGLRPAALLALSLLGWAAMGAGLFALRYRAAGFVVAVTDGFGAATAGSAAGPSPAQDRLLAWFMLCMYVGSGVLAAIDGFATSAPGQRLRRLNVAVRAHEDEAARLTGLLARLRANLQIHAHELRIVEQQRVEAHAAAAALAEELKQLARVQIAKVLGDPSASEVVHQADPCAAPLEQRADPGAAA